MEAFAKSDVGKARDMNQDYYYISTQNDETQIFILADGMGGHNAGEIARDRVRRKYFSASRSFDRHDNQLSFMDQIDNIASEQIDSIDNMDLNKPDTYYTYNPNVFYDIKNVIDLQDEYKEIINISSDGSITNDKLIELSSDEAKTPEVLLKKHGFDPEKFDLVSAKNTMWALSA